MNGRNLFLVAIVKSFKISEEDDEAIKQYLYDTVNKPHTTPSIEKTSSDSKFKFKKIRQQYRKSQRPKWSNFRIF